MKKSVIAALTGALVVGATATTFAAANPFSDVPAGHWAYNSVTKLAQEGVIEGYGDGTFLGNRNITRYEMAQMIAKAMAKNPSGASKAELDRLAAEFREELDNLGVRVAELERNADKVKWTGKIEYTYGHLKDAESHLKLQNKSNHWHDGVFRLEPRAEVNEHWSANARLDAAYNGEEDSTADAFLKRLYAQGDYNNFSVKIGRFGFCPAVEDGIVFDTNMSGIELTFGSKWKGILSVGRIGGGDEPEYGGVRYTDTLAPVVTRDGGTTDDPTDVIGLNILYDQGEKGLYGGASYYYAKDDDFNNAFYSDNGGEDKAGIWAVHLGYRFSDMLNLHGAFAQNTKADNEKYSWDANLTYGNYGDYANKGDWSVWAGYSRFGQNAAIGSNQTDDVQDGTRGWHVGAAYAPFKNVGLLVRYADGKYITGGEKFKKFFARAELFF